MVDSTLPRSPFAGAIDFQDGVPMRSIAPEELARTLQAHELYVESKQRSGKRANLDSTDLAGKSFAGLVDFAVAFITGIGSIGGNFLSFAGAPSNAMINALPLVLFPGFLVPVFIILHVMAIIKMRSMR